MNCPNCGKSLRDGATFCSGCGQAIKPAAPTPPPAARQVPPAWQAAGSAAQAAMQSQIGQLGATATTTNIWGPFAGYGTRREHTAWLLQGLGTRAEELRDTITHRFNQRQIPGANVAPVNLKGRGLAVEQRPFYEIRRGLATVWLYIARFGEDLYISEVSYVKGPISMVRVAVGGLLLALSALFALNFLGAMSGLSSMLNPFGGSSSSGAPLLLLCCTGPLGTLAFILIQIGIVFSAYKFLTEKDALALFRSTPNEFQEDDIVALEKSVNETVRQSADLIGIDLKLLAPERAHVARKRLI